MLSPPGMSTTAVGLEMTPLSPQMLQVVSKLLAIELKDRRDVILLNPDDITELGLSVDQPVTVRSEES